MEDTNVEVGAGNAGKMRNEEEPHFEQLQLT